MFITFNAVTKNRSSCQLQSTSSSCLEKTKKVLQRRTELGLRVSDQPHLDMDSKKKSTGTSLAAQQLRLHTFMARPWVGEPNQFLVGELRSHMPGSMAKVLFFLKGECKAEVYVPTPSQSKTYGLCTHNVKLHKHIPQTSRSQICLALSLLITFVVKAQKLETRKGSSNTRAAFCYCYIFPSLFQEYYSRKNYNFNN